MNTSALRHRPMRLFAGLASGLGLVLTLGAAGAPSLPSGSITSYPGGLSGVSALSPSDAWAVGSYTASTGVVKTLMLHWNGTTWTKVASPNPRGARSVSMRGVSADSPNDAWAVGGYTASTGVAKTLVLHWNGSTWAQVASPSPGGVNNSGLNAVSDLSPSDAWAVGSYFTSSGAQKTLVLHWNGSTWAQVASPSRGVPPFSTLNGVSAFRPSGAWAVGWSYFSIPDEQKTLVLHWNGTAWAQVASPNPGVGNNIFTLLNGVSALSPSSAWAVGDYLGSVADRTLVLHWDGSSWTKVASPSPGGPNNSELDAVTARSPSSAWAVGDYSTSSGAQKTLILHWNGSTWIKMTSPSPGPDLNYLFSVSAISPSSAWAVGNTYNTGSGESQTLILHWNGTSWTRS